MTRRLWVIGDSWSDPLWPNWNPSTVWPALVAARLGLALTNTSSAGAGYAAVNDRGITLRSQALGATGADADAVICLGSVNDWAQGRTAGQVYTAAGQTFAAVRSSCPGAPLLVYGPQAWAVWPDSAHADLVDAVAQAAREASAESFVDASQWMTLRPDLIAADSHPNAAGQRSIADRIAVDVLFALAPTDAAAAAQEAVGWSTPWYMPGT